MKRRMFLALCLTLALLAPLGAQEAKKDEKPAQPAVRVSTKIIEVKYQNVARLVDLLSPLVGGILRPSAEFKAITVTSDAQGVAAIEEAIKRFDVPPKNVELTVHLLSALAQAERDTVPKELEAVTKQLRALFAYQGYRLTETMILRSREGQRAEATGLGTPSPGMPMGPMYSVSYNSIGVTPDSKGNLIKLDNLRLSARVPFYPNAGSFHPNAGSGLNDKSFQYMDTGLTSNIDIHEGQKIVVGKTGMGGSDALILVVTAKVVD